MLSGRPEAVSEYGGRQVDVSRFGYKLYSVSSAMVDGQIFYDKFGEIEDVRLQSFRIFRL